MLQLGWVDWLIFLTYVLAFLLIGLYFARRQRTTDDFFVGSRRMKWWAIGGSIVATSFSSISFVALPREGAFEDFHFFVAILFIPFVITPILWYIVVPHVRGLGTTSMYAYLERRFDRRVRWAGNGLFAGYAVGWMGTMLYAMGLTLQAVLGLSDAVFVWVVLGIGLFATFYTLVGGFQAVVWTDLVQALTLGGSMAVLLVLALQQVDGGLPAVAALGWAQGKFELFSLSLDLSERRSLLTAAAYGLFMYLPGYTVSQVMVQRYLAMSTLAEARRALLINAIVNPVLTLLFIFMGTTLFVFYHQPGATGFPALPAQDQLLPYFMSNEVSMLGLTGLVVAGLFAAAMSSIDSGVNSLTAVVMHDWWPRYADSVRRSQVVSGLIGVGITLAALLMPYLGSYVIEMLTKVVGSFLGLLLGLYVLGLGFPRVRARGASLGLLAGAASVGVAWTQEAVAHWWYGGIALGVTVAVGVLASILPRR